MKKYSALIILLSLCLFICACGKTHSPSNTVEENRVEYIEESFEYRSEEGDSDHCEETNQSNYYLLTQVLDHAWNYGYLTAAGHDWIMDAYGENESDCYIRYDLEFYGDEEDQVFLKLNMENEKDAGRDWNNPDIREGELILAILDMAYYHGYISASGHDWLLDAFRENEASGYWEYDLGFYGDEEDTIFFYGYELGD